MKSDAVPSVKEVYVIVGFYSDHSGCKLFGVFATPDQANDRVDLLNAAGTPYSIRMVRMTLGKSEPQEVF